MGKTFGGTVKLSGEKEYRKALSEITSSLKAANSEMKVVSATFSKSDKSVEALTAKDKALNAQLEEQKQKVAILNGAYENAVKQYGDNSKQANNYKAQLNNAQASLIKMTDAVEKNAKELRQAEDEEKKSTTALGKLTKEFEAGAGKVKAFDQKLDNTKLGKFKQEVTETKEKFSKLKDELADTRIGKGLSALSSGFKNVASAAATVAKVSFKALGASVTAVGTAAAAAGKAVWNMANDAAQAGDTIDKQSQKMGISAEEYQKLAYAADLSGTNMGTMQKAQKALLSSGSKLPLTDALKQCADAADPAAAATEMFGAKTAQELLPMLNQGSDGIEKMMNKASDLGLVMSNDAVDASAKFQDSLTTLKGSFSAVKNGIVSNLLPGLTQTMDGFTGLLTGVDGSKEKILSGVKSMVDSLKKVGPQLTEVFSTVVGAVAEIAPQIITSLVNGILDNLNSVIDAAFSVIDSLVGALLQTENINKIINSAVSLVIKLVDGIVNNIDKIINAGFQIITSLVGALLQDDNLSKLIQAAVQLTVQITTGLLQHIPDLIDAGLQLVKGLIKGLWDNRSLIWQSIKDIAKQLVQTLKDSLGIHSPSTVTAGVGKYIVQGIWQGISNTTAWIKQKIRSWVGNVTQFLKNLFGIKSPSRKMRDEVGTMLAKGIGVGFEDEMPKVNRQIEKSIPSSYDLGVTTSVTSSVTTTVANNQAQIIASTVVSALKAFKGQVVLGEKQVGDFVIDTVEREVFA